MERDMDLVREILLEFERTEQRSVLSHQFEVEGYEDDVVQYHIDLLADAELITQTPAGQFGGKVARLTWDGHEFLDLAKNDTRWERAKREVVENVGALVFAVLKSVLTDLAMSAAGMK